MRDPGELLSAASVLLAVVSVLYGMWRVELAELEQLDVPGHAADRVKPRRDVARAINSKAVPLAVASWVLVLVLLPDGISILLEAGERLSTAGTSAVRDYDAIRTSFVVVEVFAVGLAVGSTTQLTRLNQLRRRLAPAGDDD